MEMRKILAALIVATLGFSLVGTAYGAGISVAPAEFRISNFKLGENQEVATLAITNTGTSVQNYLVQVHEPLSCREGYSPLPDEAYTENWVTFDRTYVTVPAGGTRNVKVILGIPKDDSYYNQKWEVWLDVGASNGDLVGVGVFVRMLISTEEKATLNPSGFFNMGNSLEEFNWWVFLALLVIGFFVALGVTQYVSEMWIVYFVIIMVIPAAIYTLYVAMA